MVRTGLVTAFTTGDGSIDSQAEFNTLMGLAGHIKVVNQINWCSGLIPNVIGCAPVPGNSLAVVRFSRRLEGILWAHEFGHNKGLGHRNDDPNAVMNGSIDRTHRRINEGECLGYQTPSAAIANGTEMPLDLDAHDSEANPRMAVEDFVRQVFIQGVPYNVARTYDASDIPTLLDMLSDAVNAPYWPTIVVVLGIIGDDSVASQLMAFIEADAREPALTRQHYQAKPSAIMALGYLINKTGNQQTLNYLKDGLDPQTWETKGIRAMAPHHRSIAERNTDLSKHALLGLALSGHPEAAEALRSMQRLAQTNSQQAFQAQMGNLVSEALKEHRAIADRGLADYYRKARR